MSKTILCYEPGYEPTPQQRAQDEKKVEAFVEYIRMERELKDLRKTFRSDKSYTGAMVKQVIDSRLQYLKEKASDL